MQIFFQAGKAGGGAGVYVHFYINPRNRYEELYFSMWAKLPSNFAYDGAANNFKLIPGFAGSASDKWYAGKPGAPTDSFSTMSVLRNNPKPGTVCGYIYHLDCGNSYSEKMPWNEGASGQVYWDRGNWHHYEYRVKLNTPGSRNGIIEAWYDGKLALSRNNIRWRATGQNYKIDRMLCAFIPSLSSPPSKNEYMYVDNFTISTHRVGPVQEPDTTSGPEQEANTISEIEAHIPPGKIKNFKKVK
jgi:hypothetical protein